MTDSEHASKKQDKSVDGEVLDSMGAAERRLKEMFEGETLDPNAPSDPEPPAAEETEIDQDSSYMPPHEIDNEISADDWDETGSELIDQDASATDSDAFSSLSVNQLNLWFMGIIAGKAWQDMGLIPGASNLIVKNLPECQKAIDTIEALFSLSKASLEETEQKEIATLIADLKMNFVNQSVPD